MKSKSGKGISAALFYFPTDARGKENMNSLCHTSTQKNPISGVLKTPTSGMLYDFSTSYLCHIQK